MKLLLSMLVATFSVFGDASPLFSFDNLKWDDAAYVKMGSTAPKISGWQFYRGVKVGLGSRKWNQWFGVECSGDYTYHPEFSRVGAEISLLATPAILKGIYFGAGINFSHALIISGNYRVHGNDWELPFKVGYHTRQDTGRFHFVEAGITTNKEIFVQSGLGF